MKNRKYITSAIASALIISTLTACNTPTSTTGKSPNVTKSEDNIQTKTSSTSEDTTNKQTTDLDGNSGELAEIKDITNQEEDIKSENESNDEIKVINYSWDTCKYCVEYKPIFEEFMSKYKGTAEISELTSENADTLSAEHMEKGIELYPTTIIYKGDKELEKIEGVVPLEELQKKVSELTNNNKEKESPAQTQKETSTQTPEIK